MTFHPDALTVRSLGRWALCCLVGLTCAVTGSAQPLRDPTVAPVAAGLSGPDAAQREDVLKSGSISVLTRQGVRYLMHGTRLYAVGQRIGQARIERIAETEIWLREGGQLQKVQVFSGVQRHAAVAPVAPQKPSVAPVMVRPAQTTP